MIHKCLASLTKHQAISKKAFSPGSPPLTPVRQPSVTVLVMDNQRSNDVSADVSVNNYDVKIDKYEVVMETDQEELHMTDGDSLGPTKAVIQSSPGNSSSF